MCSHAGWYTQDSTTRNSHVCAGQLSPLSGVVAPDRQALRPSFALWPGVLLISGFVTTADGAFLGDLFSGVTEENCGGTLSEQTAENGVIAGSYEAVMVAAEISSMIMIISSALLVCSFRVHWRPSLLAEKMLESAIEASIFFFFEPQPLGVTNSKLSTKPERIEKSRSALVLRMSSSQRKARVSVTGRMRYPGHQPTSRVKLSGLERTFCYPAHTVTENLSVDADTLCSVVSQLTSAPHRQHCATCAFTTLDYDTELN